MTDRYARLLLRLLPILGDTDIPEAAVSLVTEALMAQGAADPGEPLVRRLLKGHPSRGPASWSFDHDERSWI
ncbi:hypothetical protein ACH4SK_39095 [Streptomyces inhibens]|uniref:hypothetical protein n=1 Tax=Streptomyces inhibens TaxID=2293571 RepID=UPI0037A905C2